MIRELVHAAINESVSELLLGSRSVRIAHDIITAVVHDMLEELAWERVCPGYATSACLRVVNLLIEREVRVLAEDTLDDMAMSLRRRDYRVVAEVSHDRVVDLLALDRLIGTVKGTRVRRPSAPSSAVGRVLDLSILDNLLARIQ